MLAESGLFHPNRDESLQSFDFPVEYTFKDVPKFSSPGDMPNVPFRDHVWPMFLRGNALRVLGLQG